MATTSSSTGLIAGITDPLTTASLPDVTVIGDATYSQIPIDTQTAAALSSDVPRVETPEEATLIQLGFGPELNYDFVNKTTLAVDQIFEYVPKGVSYSLNITESKVVMQYLQCYDTIEYYGYRETLLLHTYLPVR